MTFITDLKHRKGTKTIQLTDASGTPIAGQEVALRLTNHQFLFGCGAFDAIEVANKSVAPDRLAFLERDRKSVV